MAGAMAFASTSQAQDIGAPSRVSEAGMDQAGELERLKMQAAEMQAQIDRLQKRSDEQEATKKAPSWADNTKISGRMYFNFSRIDQKANDVPVAGTDDSSNFEIKRLYLGIDHRFDDVFSTNLTTDLTWSSGVGATLFVKKAYLQAKLDDALTVRLGADDMPWIPFVDGIYGYRHIEPSVTDRTKLGGSTDWGVHARGKVAGGLIEYAASLVNGAGFRNPPGLGGSNRTRSLDVEGRVNLNYHGFVFGLGGYAGKLGKNVRRDPADASPAINTATRVNAMVAYRSGRFSIGGEYFRAKNWNNVTGLIATATDVKSEGWSVLSSVKLAPKWNVFGRYDHVQINDLADTNDRYWNAGIQYSPIGAIDLALVVKRSVAENGAIGTSNGIVGVPGRGSRGTYDEVGLFGQYRF